nr:putative ribonuclease H-like domain-containing protein [Tanacetum cinerariifolium]
MSWINSLVHMDSEVMEGSGKEAVSKKRTRKGLDEESVKRQKLKDDAEKEELKACLEIVLNDDKVINIETLATKSPTAKESKIYSLGSTSGIRASGEALKKKINWRLELLLLPYEPTTVEEKLDKKNEMKARGTLLMALPNKDQLKFHSYQDAKLLMEATEKSTNSTSSTNEADNTAYEVSTAHIQGNVVNSTSVDNLSDAVLYAFLSYQAKEENPTNFTLMALTSSGSSSNSDSENQENVKSRTYKGYHAVPSPYTGNYIPPKPDLIFIDEQVKSESVNVVSTISSSAVKTVALKSESVDVKNKGVCSTIETKLVRKNNFSPPINEDWISDDESDVEFEPKVKDKIVRPSIKKIKFVKTAWEIEDKDRNPQQKEYKEIGAIDSGCSRHMTENKCYLTDYKDYDGGFVSFGDGKKGKQHKASYKAKLMNSINKPLHMLHMDRFGPTNVKSLIRKSYCLVITDDFSRFYGVFFLTTKDETSEILKTFITRIENQLDYQVKVIGCDNGTEFKNSIINQFCDMKGIKREFSVPRTHQQNGVAERMNKTLIEAGRTVLVDFKLPTTFWVEAINTTCYVLNRALVIKPHNKTPYELIHGIPQLINFMKPFGCLGFQTNGIEGTKDNIVASQAEKKKEPEQEYILIPICITDPLISQNPKDSVTRSEFEGLLQQERHTEHINNTNSFNTISLPVSTVGPSFVNASLPSPINAARTPASSNAFEEHPFERFSPFKNSFSLPYFPIVTPINKTGIFGNAYDDEAIEKEVDMNNVVSSYIILDAPLTKFLKDHLNDQVIGNIKTLVQTRQMTKINEEHGLISSVQKLRRTNHKDFQNCLNKKDERVIVIKNKARLVAHGHTQEVGIEYDEVFAPVARIKAIRLFLAYASFKDFVVHQMDVKSDFLYGKIKEEVYVYQPPSFEDPNFPDRVYKVEKALYGLHQAPRAWEWEDKMKRAATIASILEAKQDNGNINRTQFMETLNEPLPQGTCLGIKHFWTTAKVKKVNDQEQIQALVDKQK